MLKRLPPLYWGALDVRVDVFCLGLVCSAGQGMLTVCMDICVA